MQFKDFKFVYITTDYLKELYDTDNEVMYIPNSNYECKPHLGILISQNNYNYVIPLTSAKEKHKHWRDVTATNYRIYEIIDTRNADIDPYDIIVDETDENKLKSMNIKEEDFKYFKKRILSVLEIKKMIPVPDSQFDIIDLNSKSNDADIENRRILMQKEYFFCRRIKDAILNKATKIYKNQMSTNIIKPYHCNYKKLEEVADKYL